MTAPIRYIERTRAYYAALGYAEPYRWARFDQVPFTRCTAPLAKTRLAVVTTAAPFDPEKGDQGPGAPYNAAAKFYQVYAMPAAPVPDLRISHIAIDRTHTTAEDPGSYLPLAALRGSGRCVMADQVFGLPTNRSHSATERDAGVLVGMIRRAEIGAAVLVPNCPVCHQSVSIAARILEANGVPTVIMGAARDIVEHVGVPRMLFSDFPLGNAAGRPKDPAGQVELAGLALDLLEQSSTPRTTWVSPQVWPGPEGWREDYSNPAKLSAEELAQRRAAFEVGKATAKTLRVNTE